MSKYFEYNDVKIPNCTFRISPSSIGAFFSYSSVWYKDHILKQKEFIASTSTVLGTIVHAAAESYCDGNPITREQAEEYMLEQAKKIPMDQPMLDIEAITAAYPDMAMTLINDYVRGNKPTLYEDAVYAEVLDDIFVGGSVDNRTQDMIVDYKTYNSSTKPKSIPWNYKIQCLAYAYCYRAMGTPINRIRLVYVNRPIDTRSISEKTGKPIGKITPPETTVLTESISPEDWKMVEDTLLLIAESVKLVKEHPEYAHLLFKSMSLKETK
jgi:hypothetical protein